LQLYARAIAVKGGAIDTWGFIDAIMIVIYRPGNEHRRYYAGYKKYHAIIF
jgi:hypothetical protein